MGALLSKLKQLKNDCPIGFLDSGIGGMGKNGESYLLDMGESIKIKDLAEQIIKFSGLEPYKDIDIKIIGKRKQEIL